MDGHTISTHRQPSASHVHVVGLPISTYSRHLVQELAAAANLTTVHITSVHRTVQDQARTFFKKHVVNGQKAKYKSQQVEQIIGHARALHAKGSVDQNVLTYLIHAIEHAHGGPQTISRHLGHSPFIEVFDVAHYSGKARDPHRHNYMTSAQALTFLQGCRKLIPFPIDRLGHSIELGITMPPREFEDENCFHLEIVQPVFDRLEVTSETKYA